ncbi:hypothetical protein BX600DRAFT_440611 [Xylariales sp. PMI_506]|nr:hypothetical protein BX600DRAFT_440611 [Xylariales sp. PMI_506]
MSRRLVADPKPIFKGVVVATAGDLGDSRFNDAAMMRYMRNYGGQFSQKLDHTVTHLIATGKQFRDKVPRVEKARRNRKVEIVTLDWLDMSMNKNKRLDVKPYSLKSRAAIIKAKERRREAAAKCIDQAESYVNTRLYSPLMDATYFRYEITLTRGELGERYLLTLFESRAKPSLYITAAKYFKSKKGKCYFWRPRETAGDYDRAMNDFKYLFVRKVGVRWEDRMLNAGPGDVVSGSPEDFQYTIPAHGKPVGYIEDIKQTDGAKKTVLSSHDNKKGGSGDGKEDSNVTVEEKNGRNLYKPNSVEDQVWSQLSSFVLNDNAATHKSSSQTPCPSTGLEKTETGAAGVLSPVSPTTGKRKVSVKFVTKGTPRGPSLCNNHDPDTLAERERRLLARQRADRCTGSSVAPKEVAAGERAGPEAKRRKKPIFLESDSDSDMEADDEVGGEEDDVQCQGTASVMGMMNQIQNARERNNAKAAAAAAADAAEAKKLDEDAKTFNSAYSSSNEVEQTLAAIV